MMKKIIIITFTLINITCNNAQNKIVPSIVNANNELFFKEVAMYNDGSLMNDSKVDNVIFIKVDGKYYKRVFSGSIKTSWFGAIGDGINDDTKAIQKAFDYAVINNLSIEVDGRYLITKPITIDRMVDDLRYDKFFTVFSNSGGGFITDRSIALFTTSLKFSSAPVSQLINFKDIAFESRDIVSESKDRFKEIYVLDASKFLRTQFNNCSFIGIRLLNANKYIQSIYLFNCNIRRWTKEFIKSTERTYDLKVNGCLVEAGEIFLNINEPYGCSIIGSTIEGMFDTAILFNGAEGFSIIGNYFEGNIGRDIVNIDQQYSNGVAVMGNFFYNTNDKYSIYWGKINSGVSQANSSLSKLHQMTNDSDVKIDDKAREKLINK